jgi:hypothetical protein
MASEVWIEKCFKVVRGNLGEGFENLCDIKPDDIRLYRYPVVGWLVTTRSPVERKRGEGDMVFASPLVLSSHVECEYRDAYVSVGTGFQAIHGELDGLMYVHKLDEGDRIVGVLPSWPNTYYVVGYVKDIAFNLGVHINPDDERLRELLLKTYLEWLKSSEARDFKYKLATLKAET